MAPDYSKSKSADEPAAQPSAFHVALMNTLHTHSTAEGDILSVCRNLMKRTSADAAMKQEGTK